jgi:hypothetical protein
MSGDNDDDGGCELLPSMPPLRVMASTAIHAGIRADNSTIKVRKNLFHHIFISPKVKL